MANITLMGASYTDVPAVTLPQTGGGTVTFYENGGSSGQSETGTFTGNNGITVQIPCSFEPDLIRIYGDLSGAVSLRGITSITFIKNDCMFAFSDTSSSLSDESVIYGVPHNMVGFNDSSLPHASYANGVLMIDMINNTSAFRFTSGIEYTYKFVKWTT